MDITRTPAQRRLVLRTVDGHYGINGIVEMPVKSLVETSEGTFKLDHVTPTYVLYVEQPRALAT